MEAYSKTSTSTVKRKNFAYNAGTTADPVPTDNVIIVGGVMNGYKNPHWRQQVRMHNDATTDLDAGVSEVKDVSGYFRATRKNKSTGLDDRWVCFAGGPYGGPAVVPLIGTVSTGLADNIAAGAFYNSARNKMSSFKGSVFAAESREAKRMIVDRSKRILSSIDPYQRRLKRRWYGKGSKRARLKLLSDSWLELQFGWRPLVSDIKDAIYALNNPRPQYSRVKGEGRIHTPVSSYNSTFNVGIGATQTTTSESTEAYVKYYGEIRAYKDPSGAGPRQDFGLQIREFLPTAWEVIPWSFAIDYFTNVSDIVNAISYAGCNFTWRAKVTKTSRMIRKTVINATGVSNASYDYRVDVDLPTMSEAKVTSITRRRSVAAEIPSLRWELPDGRQALNLAALAVSRRLRLFHT